MKIGVPYLSNSQTEVTIAADITVEHSAGKFPPNLWFKFPIASNPSLGSEPFVVALLLLAMQRAEDIELSEGISPRLLAGLDQYQTVFSEWYPERFKKIKIISPDLNTSFFKDSQNKIEACAFSGGVDSFYSFVTLKESIKSTLFMAGFDMPLQLTDSIAELTNSYQKMMADSQVEFIKGSTNVRAFLNGTDWTNAHGPSLAASALFFRDRFRTFYIPSSYTDGAYPKWGTHPDLDPLLSTESLNFVHHGSTSNRVQKLERIKDFPESYSRLRVCWIQDIGLKNCGECEKCIRTMTALRIVGSDTKYLTFDQTRKLSSKIISLKQRTYQSRLFTMELIREAWQRGRLGIVALLAFSLAKRRIKRLFAASPPRSSRA